MTYVSASSLAWTGVLAPRQQQKFPPVKIVLYQFTSISTTQQGRGLCWAPVKDSSFTGAQHNKPRPS